ncbi:MULTISPECIES: YfcL family protein [Amphritea]|uniref:YfcL protein n=2 Tax=Amphritea TaxID=515417 RepID=A0A1H9HXR9_9GAMM|nr:MULTISPECIES: YfcL family protein [Amphritea]MBN0986626.1 YfcL family protein [Amphritea pacifica]MBN1007220.1 YfcL family protein [Amphritea pacifica]SEQ67163.1 YfcL protein [Amphritea atlantica]
MNAYQQQAESIYNRLIEMEQRAEPNLLFLCSYLLGHISLVSAEQGDTADQFNQRVENSLEDAFKIDKLSTEDLHDIRSLWAQLSETDA